MRQQQAEKIHQMLAWPLGLCMQLDFRVDATTDGRRVKLLNLSDEHNRLCQAIQWEGVGAAEAAPTRPPSNPVSRDRTAWPSLTTTTSGMSSRTPSYSPRWPRPRAWLIAGQRKESVPSGPIQPPRGLRPWGQLKSLQHHHPLSFHLDP